MAKKRKKTRRTQRKSILQLIRESWFYRIYFALLAFCTVALVFGLITLHGVMREYEQTRPVHFAEEVLDTLTQRNWAEIREIDEGAKKLRYETADQYAQYMNDLTAGKVFSIKSVLSIDENEPKYSLLLDGSKFGEMILTHSDETTKHNFARWQLKSLEITAVQSNAFTITVPADSTVQVNGQTLGPDDVLESGLPTEANGNLPDGVTAPTLTKYGVYMSFGSPDEIRVTDKNGNAQELTQDDERSWSCGLAYDDSIKDQIESNVVTWGRRLAAFTSDDYSKIDLSNACINPSPARSFIRNMENQWAAAHTGYDFQNIQTYDYYVYSDSCFSCRISFDYIIHYKQGDQTYPTKYTLYFAKDGGTFKLYNFTMD